MHFDDWEFWICSGLLWYNLLMWLADGIKEASTLLLSVTVLLGHSVTEVLLCEVGVQWLLHQYKKAFAVKKILFVIMNLALLYTAC